MNQEPTHTPDQWTEGPESYVYRDGNWTTPTGYCLNTARGHELTMKFYERHGRVPFSPPPVKLLATRRTKAASPKAAATVAPAEKPRSAAVKAAIARALAAKAALTAPAASPLGSKPRAQARARITAGKAASSRARRPSVSQ
jgi:hypothetical protein